MLSVTQTEILWTHEIRVKKSIGGLLSLRQWRQTSQTTAFLSTNFYHIFYLILKSLFEIIFDIVT